VLKELPVYSLQFGVGANGALGSSHSVSRSRAHHADASMSRDGVLT
jgi:hypothetical protein